MSTADAAGAATIRAFDSSDRDYAAVAGICARSPAALLDYEFTGGPQLRAFDGSFGPGRGPRRLLAEQSGVPIGYAAWFPTLWAPQTGGAWAIVRVASEQRGRGIGSLLGYRVLAQIAAFGATLLQGQVRDETPAKAALERHGFHEVYRTWELGLDLRTLDPARPSRSAERAAAAGVTITTLADEMRHDPGWLQKLYELHTTLVRDVPLPEQPDPEAPVEWFERYAASGPAALTDGFFIAKDGQRYVGESFVQRDDDDPGHLHHKITGTLRSHRGRGIAGALKLLTIDYARAKGCTLITTWNESNNPEMLAINARLGFVRRDELIIVERPLPNAAHKEGGERSEGWGAN